MSCYFPLFVCTGTQQKRLGNLGLPPGKTNCKQQQVLLQNTEKRPDSKHSTWFLSRWQDPAHCLAVASFSCGFLYALHYNTVGSDIGFTVQTSLFFLRQASHWARKTKEWFRTIMWEVWGHLNTSPKELNQSEVEHKKAAKYTMSYARTLLFSFFLENTLYTLYTNLKCF